MIVSPLDVRFAAGSNQGVKARQFHALRPDIATLRAMLRDLESVYGRQHTADLLGVSIKTVERWHADVTRPGPLKAVWLVWALLLHPEVIKTEFDILTWGRFRRLESGGRRPDPGEQPFGPDFQSPPAD